MRIWGLRFYLPMALCLLLASGCGTVQMYDGPAKPPEEVTLVYKNTPPSQWARISIGIITMPIGLIIHMLTAGGGDQETAVRKVDGKEIGLWDLLWTSKVAVRPGSHRFEIGYRFKRSDVSVRCEAGHRYVAKANNPWNGDPSFVWIEDLDTGSVLAGRAPQAVLDHAREREQRAREQRERERRERMEEAKPQKTKTDTRKPPAVKKPRKPVRSRTGDDSGLDELDALDDL